MFHIGRRNNYACNGLTVGLALAYEMEQMSILISFRFVLRESTLFGEISLKSVDFFQR